MYKPIQNSFLLLICTLISTSVTIASENETLKAEQSLTELTAHVSEINESIKKHKKDVEAFRQQYQAKIKGQKNPILKKMKNKIQTYLDNWRDSQQELTESQNLLNEILTEMADFDSTPGNHQTQLTTTTDTTTTHNNVQLFCLTLGGMGVGVCSVLVYQKFTKQNPAAKKAKQAPSKMLT